MLALSLILKSNGGKQHLLPFVGSNLRIEIFLKKREHQKKGACKACLLFCCFLLTTRILKALFSFIPLLLNLSDFPSYTSNSSKRTDSLFKESHKEFGQLETSRVTSEKLKFFGLLLSKKTFLQLKHYIQRIYLTLLLTTCTFNYLKIHQISYVNFESISHFSQHASSVFFLAQIVHTFDKSRQSKYKFLDFQLLEFNFTQFLVFQFQFPNSIFQTKCLFLFKVSIALQCH